MSRLRNVDRRVLESSSDDFLDTDDQTLLIDNLSAQNVQSYNRGKFYLSATLLVQLPVLIYLEHHYHGSNSNSVRLRLILITLSTILTLVSLRYDSRIFPTSFPRSLSHLINISPQLANLTNIAISAQLVYTYDWSLEKLYYLLPTVNLVNLISFKWWHTHIGKEVDDLNKLKYKFKTV